MNLSYLQNASVAALLSDRKTMSPKARLDAADSDMTADAAAQHVDRDLAMRAASTVQQWAETEDSDLGEGEGHADRLWGMLVGTANDGADGELSEDEQTIAGSAANSAWEYMAAKGVTDDDLDTIFNGDDPAEANATASRVREYMAGNLPDGDDAAADEADDFAFSDGGDQGSIYDAVYKKKVVVKNGKKVKVNKRISGVVRLSAPQKVAIRKAHMKSHSAKAMVKRMKSLRVRKAANL